MLSSQQLLSRIRPACACIDNVERGSVLFSGELKKWKYYSVIKNKRKAGV
jgi:hypothetical protein